MSTIKSILEKASTDATQLAELTKPFYNYIANDFTRFGSMADMHNQAHGVFVTGAPEFDHKFVLLSLSPPNNPGPLNKLIDILELDQPAGIAQFAADLIKNHEDYQCKIVAGKILHTLSSIKQAKPTLIISLQPKYYLRNILSCKSLAEIKQYQFLVEYNTGNKILLYEEIYNSKAIQAFIPDNVIDCNPDLEKESSPMAAIIGLIAAHLSDSPAISSTTQATIRERPIGKSFERMLFGALTCLT
jgi:hypothetical protein